MKELERFWRILYGKISSGSGILSTTFIYVAFILSVTFTYVDFAISMTFAYVDFVLSVTFIYT